MALQIRRGKSKWWYGRIEVYGRKLNKNLGVEICGTVPLKLSQVGDIAFERSRARAQAALERFQLDAKKRSTAEELIQAIHEIRTGARVSTVPFTDIIAKWKDLPRRRRISERYAEQAESRVKRFVDFVRKTNPTINEMSQVQSTMARAFMKKMEERGVAAKTYNNIVIFLRSVFHTLRKEAGLAENPFDGIPAKDGEAIFRTPFTVEELGLILEHAKADPFIYPLIVTGMCTAMRRGDCCMLLRASVDMKGSFITVKTSKTGEYVQIPIFPLFREVLEKALAEPSPRAPHYVFPSLEAHYKINPDHLTDRVGRVMRAAGFFNANTEEEKKNSRGDIQRTRKEGLRKASVRDFHSFRVTWVTLALTAGVPLEIVQKVTGHRTASIVMKHYFQPGREEFRRTLAGKMPALLVGGAPKVEALSLSEVRAKLEGMESRNWREIRDELLARLSPESEKIIPAKVVQIEVLASVASPYFAVNGARRSASTGASSNS